VQVPYDEGVAIRVGPEPCADVRKGAGEASAGESTGQPLNRERPIIPGADTVPNVEAIRTGAPLASARTTRRGHRPWHVRKLLVREPGGPTAGRQRSFCALLRSASGRRGAEADDVRPWEV